MESDKPQGHQQRDSTTGTISGTTQSQELRMQVHALSLVDSMFDVYYQTDMQGHLLLISPSCFSQTGYRPEEVIGKNVTDFYADPDQREALLNILREHGLVSDFTVKLIHKDGQPRYASVTSRLMLNEHHEPIGIEGILRNVTSRYCTDSEHEKLLRENRQLMRMLIQAQEEERSRLVYDLHNELEQLLNRIDTSAAYIAEHAGDEDVRANAEEIQRDVRAAFEGSHGVLMGLGPGTLDTLGLQAALKKLADRWNGMPGAECLLEVDGDIDQLELLTSIAIYRLIEEGIANACRYGKECRTTIRVKRLAVEGKAVVRVLFLVDGKDLQVEALASGLGMMGMQARTHALGGAFTLTQVPQNGLHIEATIPEQMDVDE